MKKIIHTTKAPAPLGPYNQGIAIDGVLYVSGQIAIHPETGRLENKDIQTETVRVMKNIEAILREAGTTFENVVKTSILLTNMDDFVQSFRTINLSNETHFLNLDNTKNDTDKGCIEQGSSLYFILSPISYSLY